MTPPIVPLPDDTTLDAARDRARAAVAASGPRVHIRRRDARVTEDELGDLICDLLHLGAAEVDDFNIDWLLGWAREHYEVEQREAAG